MFSQMWKCTEMSKTGESFWGRNNWFGWHYLLKSSSEMPLKQVWYSSVNSGEFCCVAYIWYHLQLLHQVGRTHPKCTHNLWMPLDEHSPLQPTCQLNKRIPAVYSFPPGRTQYTRSQSIYLGCKLKENFYQKLHVNILAIDTTNKIKLFQNWKKNKPAFLPHFNVLY